MRARAALCLSTTLLLACTASVQAPSGYDEAERFVVAIHACLPPSSGRPTGIPFDAITITTIQIGPSTLGVGQGAIECVLAAGGDCVRVRACFGMELYADDRCAQATSSCEGNTAVLCTPSPRVGIPPTRTRSDCGAGSCDPGGICSPETCALLVGCDGDARTFVCPSGAYTIPCDPGSTCAGAPNAICAGAGPVCARNACAGDLLSICDTADLRVRATLDCAARGARCVTDETGAHCQPTSTACTPATAPPTCAGDDLVYCGPGADLRHFDCRAHGFGTCLVNGTTFAPDTRCVPDTNRLF